MCRFREVRWANNKREKEREKLLSFYWQQSSQTHIFFSPNPEPLIKQSKFMAKFTPHCIRIHRLLVQICCALAMETVDRSLCCTRSHSYWDAYKMEKSHEAFTGVGGTVWESERSSDAKWKSIENNEQCANPCNGINNEQNVWNSYNLWLWLLNDGR